MNIMPSPEKVAALKAAREQVYAIERELNEDWEALNLHHDSRQWTPEQQAINSAYARLLGPF